MNASVRQEDFIARLREIVGPSGVLEGDDVQSRYPGYFMDRIGARVMVRPATTAEISAVMALCNARGQSVVTQGGMSGWVRGTQTTEDDLILSLERMNRIEEIDTVNRTATVEAGVILQTLQEAVEQHQLVFPLDLGGRGSCQLGGNASTNAGGLRVIRYGMMRQLVLGVEAVLADGTVVSSLNKMIKNNAGYDLKQLFLGTEGTLGIITRLVLRLHEQPLGSNTCMVALADFAKVASFLRFMDRSLGGTLSAFEVIDRDFYAINTAPGRHRPPITGDHPFYVLLETLGYDRARDEEQFETILNEALEEGLIEDAVLPRSEAEREALWAIREDLEHILTDIKPFQAFDVSLPIGEMDAYMTAVRARVSDRWPDARICFLGHVGDGNLHIAIGSGSALPGDSRAVEECVYHPLQAVGGSVSAEHGIGLEKKDFLHISRSDNEIALMRLLKSSLDPKAILNPGKVFDPVPGCAP